MATFEGTISNCKKEVLTHTSGNVNISTGNFTGVTGGGNITTSHQHYTDFEIDDNVFRCYGNLIFKDGDRVKLYAYKTNNGYYYVTYIENFTRDFCQASSKADNPPKSMFGAISKGIFLNLKGILIASTIITFLVLYFFNPPNFVTVATWIGISVVCILVNIWYRISEYKDYIADFKSNNKA